MSFQKLYLYAATSSDTGTLPPSTNQSGVTVNVTASGASTSREMISAIGTLQTSIAISTAATTSAQKNWLGRWVSPPLSSQTIASGTWSFSCAGSESSTNSNFKVSPSIYIWRPSTGAQVGTILAVGSVTTQTTTTSESSLTNTALSGSAVTIAAGDILVVEVFGVNTQSMGTSYTNTFYYGGSTEASTSSNAAFLRAPAVISSPGTTYTLTGPSSGNTNTASSNFTVTPDGLYTGTITPAVSGVTGTFSPTSLSYSNSEAAQTFTFTPSAAGTATISTTSSPTLTNPSSLTYTVTQGATKFTASYTSLTGWSGGVSPSFEFTPDGNYTGTITPSDGGAGGSFNPPNSTYSNSTFQSIFQYKPAAAGTVTLSLSSSPSITNPSPVSYTSHPYPVLTYVGASGLALASANRNTVTLTPGLIGFVNSQACLAAYWAVSPGTVTANYSAGGSLTQDQSLSGATAAGVFSGTEGTGAGHDVTYSFGAAAGYAYGACVFEIAGLLATTMVDVLASASGTGTAPSPGSITTTEAYDCVVLIMTTNYSGTSTSSLPSGFTSIYSNLDSTKGPVGEVAYALVNNPGTITPSWTVSSASWSSVAVGYRVATYTMTGPTSGVVNAASTNFTITPNFGYNAGTITPSDGGAGGTFSPTSLTFFGSTAQTFTYTPASSGVKSISVKSSPELLNPAGISYTATAAPAQTMIWCEPGTDATGDLSLYTGTGGTATGTVASDNTVSVTGTRSLKLTTSTTTASTIRVKGVLADAGRRVSVRFRFSALPPSGQVSQFLGFGTSGGTAVSCSALFLDSTGKLFGWTSGTTVLAVNTWYRITYAYSVTSASVNTYKTYINGTLEMTSTNQATTTGSADFFVASDLTWVNGTLLWFDDIYIDAGNDSGDPGDIQVTHKKPVADRQANMTTSLGSAAGSHYPWVSEIPLNTANGWQSTGTGSSTNESYDLETAAVGVGSMNLTSAMIVARSAWVSVAVSASSGTLGMSIIDGGSATSYTLASTNGIQTVRVNTTSATYPTTVGAVGGIGVVTPTGSAGTPQSLSLFECGQLIAYTGSSTLIVSSSSGSVPNSFMLMGCGV